MDIMTKLLEENHIDLPYFARGWEHKQGSGNPEHAFSALVKPIYDIFVSYGFVSDLPSDISKSKPQSVQQSFLPKLVIFC